MSQPCPNSSLEYENVNGVKLMLNVYKRDTSPNSRLFIITYKNSRKKSSRIGLKTSLLLAFLFNLLAFFYVRISLTSILLIIVVLSALVCFWFTHCVQSESLLVIPTVCIQSTIKYVWGREDTYLDWSNIDDVIINEVIKMNRVLYYLTVLIKQDPSNTNNINNPENVQLVPIFKHTKPRLVMLQKVYSEIQKFLMDSQTETAMASGDKE